MLSLQGVGLPPVSTRFGSLLQQLPGCMDGSARQTLGWRVCGPRPGFDLRSAFRAVSICGACWETVAAARRLSPGQPYVSMLQALGRTSAAGWFDGRFAGGLLVCLAG